MQAYILAFSDGKFDKENIRFVKKPGGSIKESNLIKGIIVKKRKSTSQHAKQNRKLANSHQQ